MRKRNSFSFALLGTLLATSLVHSQTESQIQKFTQSYDRPTLNTLVNSLRKESNDKLQIARKSGFLMSYEVKAGQGGAEAGQGPGYFAAIQSVTSEGKPVYYRTLNDSAARSTRTNLLHGPAGLGLNLTGKNLTAYVWDGGSARTDHVEFGTRMSIGDAITGYNGLGSDHATHVAGTMMAAGLDPTAKGMAFEAKGKTFDWNYDRAEAVVEAVNGMLVSNHSYGFNVRDQNGQPSLPPSYFGGYLYEARAWDEIMHNAPYYLMVVAAGNDGNDNGANQTPLQGNPGFDKLTGHCVAKNNLVVANAQDVAVDAAGLIVSPPLITSSSSEGPTDDFRIKPDLAGNGNEVRSTVHKGAVANNLYEQQNWTGTSMAAPNVSGSLLLLQELYDQKHSQFMRAATLKGLAIHTADDAGIVGPDAIFGWGVMNAKFAAETIVKARNGNAILNELTLVDNGESKLRFKSKGNVRVSISWTDPPGRERAETEINDPSATLVNDLNLRLTRNGVTLQPWRLDSVSTNSTGSNNVDPIERIDDTQQFGAEVEYELVVTHAGSLTGGEQAYSLIVTGDGIDTGIPGRILPGDPVGAGSDDVQNRIDKVIEELESIKSLLNSTSNQQGGMDDPVSNDLKMGESSSKLLLQELKALSSEKGLSNDLVVQKLREFLNEIKQAPESFGVPEGGESRPEFGIPEGLGNSLGR